ncbi:MAG: hypothetical protein EOM50_20795, partial [Erysipelotrichia bacterium]|nr:hypothetical protein [Erysipelotrichia bacterium]
AYYRLFMSMTGYRESCYDCKYSSIKKPSDITLGDYYIGESKSKYIKGLHFSNDTFYSCVITHSIKGEEILRKIDCQYTEIPTEDAIEDHEHLKHSSLPTNTGITMLKIYQRGGFKKLQDYLRLRNGIVDIVRLFRN